MTDKRLITCLWFDNEAEAAANHYTAIFPDSTIENITRYTAAGPGPAGSVLTVEFTLNDQKFVALNGGKVEFGFTEAVSFQIPCADQDAVDYYWTRLTEGGQPGPCGWLKDRYGVSWQVVPTALMEMLGDPDGAKAARTAKAMFTMSKLDIAALRRAHAGG